MRWFWVVCGVVGMLVVSASCSAPSLCDVAPGTPIGQLDARPWTSGYADVGPNGPIPGSFRACCAGGPSFPFPDGGCGEVCDGQPRVDIYERMTGVDCEEDGRGDFRCLYWVMDGGVVASSQSCFT